MALFFGLRSTGTSFLNAGTLVSSPYGNFAGYPDRVRIMDFNGDGLLDIILGPESSGNWYRIDNSGGVPDRVAQISSTPGGTVSVSYKALPNNPGVYTPSSVPVSYPLQNAIPPLYVVDSQVESGGQSGTTLAYQYNGLRLDLSGRGLLGFAWMQSQNLTTGLVTRQSYRQDWPYTGLLDKLEQGTSVSNWSNLGTSTYQYDCTDFDITPGCQSAVGKRYFPFATRVEETKFDLNGSALPMTRTDTLYDCTNASTNCYGNALSVSAATLNPDGSPTGYGKQTQSQFYNDDSAWILGRLLRSSVIHSTP